MALDPKFQKFTTTSPIIATFNFTDIADGTGVIVLNGFDHKEETTRAYALSDQTMFGQNVYTVGSSTSNSFTKVLDLDFDLSPFNLSRRIKGTARAIFTIGSGANSASNALEVYAIVKIRKWDDSNETEIASAQSATAIGVSQEINYTPMNVEIDISTEEYFAQGETLRVTMEIWAKKISINNTNVYLLHDPQNRIDSGSVPQFAGTNAVFSTLKFNIPFKIDT